MSARITTAQWPAGFSPAPLLSLLGHWAHQRPQAPALIDPLATTSYRQLLAQVVETGVRLRALGLGHDARVALSATSAPAMARLFLGLGSHLTVIPVDPGLQPEVAARLFRRLAPEAIVVAAGDAPGPEAAARAQGIPLLPATGGELAAAPPSVGMGLPDTGERAASLDSVLYILASSGTTGQPKLIPRTQASILESSLIRAQELGLCETDISIVPMPMHHAFGVVTLLRALSVGGACVCLGHFEFKAFAAWATRTQASCCGASPVVLEELLRASQAEPGWLADWKPKVIAIASSTLRDAVCDALRLRFGAQVLGSYGMTEASGIATSCVAEPWKPPGAAGRPRSVHVQIVDPQGQPVPTQAVGEIMVRGPGVFKGYVDDAQLNARAFVGEWFRTGDLGRLDADGFLYLEGRLSEVISRGGAKVSAREVEQWLMNQPGVKLAVVFAVPHASLGEDVVAAIVPVPGCALEGRRLRLDMLEVLQGYKVPSRIVVVASLPLGPAGKVRREGLPDLLKDALAPRHRAPVTATEHQVAALMARTLHIDTLGMDDNFFSLGGHSLLAVRMLARLQADTGRHIAPAAFMREPSAGGLVALLQADAGAALHPAVEPYRLQGSDPPLFYAPGYNGHSHELHLLLPYLSQGYPVFGLNAPDELTTGADPIDDIAAFCVQRIRAIRPAGPYRLAGYSFGGAVAQAIACRLQALGETVSLLFIVDTGTTLDDSSSAASNLPHRLEDTGACHTWRVFNGRTTLLRAWARPYVELVMPGLGWEYLSSAGVDVFDLPTTHRGLLGEHASDVALILSACLAQAQGADVARPTTRRPDFEIAACVLPQAFFSARAQALAGQEALALQELLALDNESLPGWALLWVARLVVRLRAATGQDHAGVLVALEARTCPRTRQSAMQLGYELARRRHAHCLELLQRRALPGVRDQTVLLARALVARNAGFMNQANAALAQLEPLIKRQPDLYATMVRQLSEGQDLQVLEHFLGGVRQRCSPSVQSELLAWACRTAGQAQDWPRAAQYGLEAICVWRGPPAHCGSLIQALVKLGRHEEAAAVHREALEYFPARWGRHEALDRALAGDP